MDAKVDSSDSWMGKYIFPNSALSSLAQISQASQEILEPGIYSFGNLSSQKKASLEAINQSDKSATIRL